jgi:putative component of toxin-antitoxin plasmid stabilization module
MTAKSDLRQNKPQDQKRSIAEHLAKRGLPGDLEAVRAMGFDLERSEGAGWRLRG